MNLLDDYCQEVVEKNRNMLVPWWIMSAWAYEQATPIISDGMFDKLADRLTKEWSKVEHDHKSLLDKKSLKTSLAIAGKWPQISKASAQGLIRIVASKNFHLLKKPYPKETPNVQPKSNGPAPKPLSKRRTLDEGPQAQAQRKKVPAGNAAATRVKPGAKGNPGSSPGQARAKGNKEPLRLPVKRAGPKAR